MPVTVICLMGPTAAGKTALAVEVARRLPVSVISVDSAMVYRGLDIGTGKPDAALQAEVPHALVDIREPWEAYSAGDFARDARLAIEAAAAAGRVPLLVGGTHLYFRSLVAGIAPLPRADAGVRAAIDAEGEARGWPALHAELARIDPAAAARIGPADRQRIQRALEVYRLTGRPLSAHWRDQPPATDFAFRRLALVPADRAALHARIERRFDQMLEQGLVGEVATLRALPGMSVDRPALRAVGYRQLWAHVSGEEPLERSREKAIAATRQLARRQLIWLRSEPEVEVLDPASPRSAVAVLDAVADAISQPSR
jgi:tRNA dimethylallyltransferase